MRVWAVSDLHTDYKDNMAWAEQLCSSRECRQDALIVAGDVSDNLDTLARTLELLTSAYGHVFFVPGNHDLWCRREERQRHDSLVKLQLVRDTCARLGVHTSPACVGGVWVFPLLSWYHASWDREPDLPGAIPIEKVMMDFHACTWTSVPGLRAGDDSVARHMDALNDPAFGEALAAVEREERETGRRPPVVSFSHFLPFQELLPEKRMLHYPNLAKAAGSDPLAARVARLRPAAHVFGHTHFSWDAVGPHGVRFVQWPLGYPAEQRRRSRPVSEWRPMLVWDGERDALSSPRACYWSSHYAVAGRRPHVLTPAPWVSA
ncbi:hypothetical protein QBZ16_000429 [Prototheca wickerhamii]|uniref:Calcineurin-like phosphoesterase domain-containing protein n=1 Tax=Prototheca wickerhamii TaxID=3111 RepID=A0AAD9IN61_PROWI|nr:hypothetical protein QBZ16_000429 [Prototheca wickerhamii]